MLFSVIENDLVFGRLLSYNEVHSSTFPNFFFNRAIFRTIYYVHLINEANVLDQTPHLWRAFCQTLR
jgi:hypothetical protein